MFTSLRSRLLLSYAAVILTILASLSVAIIPLLAVPNQITIEQNGGRLVRLARQLQAQGRGQLANFTPARLTEWGAQEEVRILLVGEGNLVLFDTAETWPLHTAAPLLEAIPARQMPNMGSGAGAGLTAEIRQNLAQFEDAQGAQWLALPQAIGPASRSNTLLLALPAPTWRENVRRFLGGPILQASATALLLASLLAYIIHRSVARPLQHVATAAHALASGDYSQRVVPSGPREVQTLAASFNQMAEQVQQSQQAQRDFVANVSHDLKTPLTAVQGWSQALLDGTAATPALQNRAATTIHAETERMTRLVNQLLDLARLEAGQLTLHPTMQRFQDLLQEVHTTLLPRAQAQAVQLELECPPTAVYGMVDKDRFIQIITNLVDNALKNTPADGTITMRLTAEPPHHLRLQVADTGQGIPPADLPRIFERFYQVDKSRVQQGGAADGTNGRASVGLGLAIVRQLVSAHGGHITAESTLGRGTTFTLRLPAHPLQNLPTPL